MSKNKKSGKLLVQMGFMATALFLTVIVLILIIVYFGAVNIYLGAKNDMLSTELDRVYNAIQSGNTQWVFDYWEKHPKDIMNYNSDTELSQEAKELFDKEKWDLEALDSLDEKDQLTIAYTVYTMLTMTFSYEKNNSKYDSLFCIDVSDDNTGFVFFNSADEQNASLGDRWKFDVNDHTAVEKLLSSGSTKPEFEKVEDFPLKGSHYVGYLPVMIDGKVRCVIGISYDWTEFNSGLRSQIFVMAAAGVFGIVMIAAVLLWFVYKKAIHPLTKVQLGVRDYMVDKDRKKAQDKMTAITVNNEVGVLAQDISELALEIERYTNENIMLTSERERVSAELDMAKQIQAGQLPSSFPAFPDKTEFDIYAAMMPAKEVGGDFYDYFLIDDDHLGLVMADVSGKGVPAALFMMMSKMLINNFASMGLEPHEVLERTNEAICKNNKMKMFVTVWFGILEISTGKITAANAGHEYPIIRQPGGQFELFKDKHGFVIGYKRNKKYKQYEFTLRKGGTLLLYTDGVPEATSADEKMFGTAKTIEVLNKDPDAKPQQLLKNVHDAVDRFVGDAPQFDDLTMLGITLL